MVIQATPSPTETTGALQASALRAETSLLVAEQARIISRSQLCLRHRQRLFQTTEAREMPMEFKDRWILRMPLSSSLVSIPIPTISNKQIKVGRMKANSSIRIPLQWISCKSTLPMKLPFFHHSLLSILIDMCIEMEVQRSWALRNPRAQSIKQAKYLKPTSKARSKSTLKPPSTKSWPSTLSSTLFRMFKVQPAMERRAEILEQAKSWCHRRHLLIPLWVIMQVAASRLPTIRLLSKALGLWLLLPTLWTYQRMQTFRLKFFKQGCCQVTKRRPVRERAEADLTSTINHREISKCCNTRQLLCRSWILSWLWMITLRELSTPKPWDPLKAMLTHQQHWTNYRKVS